MSQYIIVNPKDRTIKPVLAETLDEAKLVAGLAIDSTDHGSLVRGLGYVVYEYGLFVPPAQQSYFGVAGKLIAGTAVFYRYDDMGETQDLRLSEFPDVRWYLGVNDVEASIDRGEIVRPTMSMNNVVFWQWPDPPKGMGHGN
jgi:hypothetical protein